MIRQVRPRRVLTQSPERWWERLGASHPDHLAAGEATVQAVYPAARNPFAFPELLADEGLEAWTVPELWLMADPQVGPSGRHHRRRSRASWRRCGPTSARPRTTRTWRACCGSGPAADRQRLGLPEGRLAESFRVVAIA